LTTRSGREIYRIKNREKERERERERKGERMESERKETRVVVIVKSKEGRNA